VSQTGAGLGPVLWQVSSLLSFEAWDMFARN
jgi:hypothetical protein